MTLEIIWPLKFVLVCKVAQVSVSVNLAADGCKSACGAISGSGSLPSGYWLVGWLLRVPIIGQQVYVLRITRNGVVVPGCFVSTEVLAVPSEHEFHTVNSVYHWEEIGIVPGCETDHRPR
jgi:hypothetical protein